MCEACHGEGQLVTLGAVRTAIEEARKEERKEITHHWNKAEQRLDGTMEGAANAIEQFRNYLTKHE